MRPVDIVIRNSQIFTANPVNPIIHNGAIAIRNGDIVWVGTDADLPNQLLANATQELSFPKGWVTPGLIDCHTHLVYAGNRSDEFRRQLAGESYQDISASGGGILATVKATRNATKEELYSQAEQRLQHWLKDGVTHIEIKSGYGLDTDTELKMLEVAQQLARDFPIGVSKTLLAAHSLAPEYANRFANIELAKQAFIDHICEEIIPKALAMNLVDAIDGFCETIAFSTQQIEQVFQTAQSNNIAVKLHAEQLSNQQGSLLAANYGAMSVDHLEYLDEPSIKAMANSGTVAVLLPAAFYFLQETQLPPINLLRNYNIPIAIATDHNPGSSPVQSMSLMLNMACRLFGLSPTEALMGATINAAKALAIDSRKGSIELEKQADILHWPISELDDLSYYFGAHQPDTIIQNGQLRNSIPKEMP